MFDFGFSEMAVTALVALVVVVMGKRTRLPMLGVLLVVFAAEVLFLASNTTKI